MSCEFASDHTTTCTGAVVPSPRVIAADAEHDHEGAMRLAEQTRTTTRIKPGTTESWREEGAPYECCSIATASLLQKQFMFSKKKNRNAATRCTVLRFHFKVSNVVS